MKCWQLGNFRREALHCFQLDGRRGNLKQTDLCTYLFIYLSGIYVIEKYIKNQEANRKCTDISKWLSNWNAVQNLDEQNIPQHLYGFLDLNLKLNVQENHF